MNAREKLLLIALVGIVGLPGLFYGGKRFWWNPLMEYREQASKLQDDVDRVNEDVRRFREGQVNLNKARLRSLPASPEQASAVYHKYLKELLIDSGLSVDETTPQNVVKVKPAAPIPGVTAVGHQILPFTVRVNGELSALVTALEAMQKTPYEHRVKSLTVDRSEAAGSKKPLSIQMNIEVLLVAGTKNKPGSPLNSELIKALPDDRQYAQISMRNIFEGALPPPAWVDKTPKETVKKDEKPEPEIEPSEETPKYVYLTHTSPDEQVAYLRNHLNDKGERKMMSTPGSGYDIFVLKDEAGEYTFFRAKVLKIQLREVFIQIKDEVYSIHIGQSLADMKLYGFGLSRIELEDDGLFDRAFMEEEMGKTKKTTKDNKGKTKKKS